MANYKNNIDKRIKKFICLDKYAFDFFNKSFDKFPLHEIIYTWTYGSIKTLFTPGL